MDKLDALIADAEEWLPVNEDSALDMAMSPAVVIALCRVAKAAEHWSHIAQFEQRLGYEQYIAAALRDLDAVLK